MKTSSENLIESIQRACWDAEIIWVATSNNETFLDVEPPGHSDRPIARDLSLTLTSRAKHPKLAWEQVWHNLGEGSYLVRLVAW